MARKSAWSLWRTLRIRLGSVAVRGARLFAETEEAVWHPAGGRRDHRLLPEFEATIERFERASGLPSPHLGGVWGKRSPWIKRSYLFITRFKESDTDDVIAFAKRGRFDMILIDQGSWCIHRSLPDQHAQLPRGLDSLRDTVARFKQAGFKVGLHYLAPPSIRRIPTSPRCLIHAS